MIAVLTVLIALPLGYLVRGRLAANVAFGLAFAHVYTFQTAFLLMDWVKGGDGTFPQDISSGPTGAVASYLAVSSAVYAAGFGLVALGHLLRRRRGIRHSDLTAGVAR
jgi:hypothetical protein